MAEWAISLKIVFFAAGIPYALARLLTTALQADHRVAKRALT